MIQDCNGWKDDIATMAQQVRDLRDDIARALKGELEVAEHRPLLRRAHDSLQEMMFLLSDRVLLHTLLGQLAEARAEYEKGSDPTAERLRRVVRILGFERAGRFPRRDVVESYWDLTTRPGRVLLRWTLTVDEELEPFTLKESAVPGCPLSPKDAISTIKAFYGFQSYDACLRFLQEQRKTIRDAEKDLLGDTPHPWIRVLDAEGLESLLSALSRIPHSRNR